MIDSPVAKFLAPLDVEPAQAFASNLSQVPDLLEFALDYTGPADVTITSFSISEEFIRRLFFIRKKGLVKSLRVVLDFKATQKTLILWPFLSQTIENCFLADNHSKAIIAQGADKIAAAVMSQNLTRGNRFECGAIFSDPDICLALKSQIDELVKYHSAPFSDVYPRTARTN